MYSYLVTNKYLYLFWVFSVHNWTTDDVELWLKDVVGLPQYLPVFKKYKIDGNTLPRYVYLKSCLKGPIIVFGLWYWSYFYMFFTVLLYRLALNTDHLIQNQLGISDQQHKNKLILKAMDLVLFGPPAGIYYIL